MSQLSLCFWAELTADDDNRREDWLVSIARPGLCKYSQCAKIQHNSLCRNFFFNFFSIIFSLFVYLMKQNVDKNF